jgi:hypothetical protein
MQTENEPLVVSRPGAVEPPWAQQVLIDVATIRSRLALISEEAAEVGREYEFSAVGPVLEELAVIKGLLRNTESAAGLLRPSAPRLRNWWNGGRVERARRLVQEADIRLVRVVPGEASEAANLSHAIKHGLRLGPDDPIRLRLERFTGPLYQERLGPVAKRAASSEKAGR